MSAILDRSGTGQGAGEGPVAVIDIGSNSIRLVVYDGAGRAPLPVFNEKVLCGLARGLDATGRLDPAAVDLALGSLGRFMALLAAMGVRRVDAVATAAVREADDGPDFVDAVRRQHGLDVRVLTGADEARLSALGVVSAIPGADGLMGDLGGGSVEIVALHNGEPDRLATLPLGSLRLVDDFGRSMKRAHRRVDQHIASLDWLGKTCGKTFYAVGGAWRALARVHMTYIDYPLHVVHGYRVRADAAIDFCRFVAELSHSTLARTPGVGRQRVATLPHAALLLRRLLEISAAEDVVFCTYGLREGCLFDRLPQAVRKRDPLIEAARAVARRTGRPTVDGAVLFRWMDGVFIDESVEQRRQRLAACHLADVAWAEHPDYRCEQAFLRILRMPLVGIDHPGRVYLAASVAARHAALDEAMIRRYAGALLDDEGLARARATGLAMRLGYTVSGGVVSLLEKIVVRRSGTRLVLELPDHADILVGDVVERRFRSLARAIGCSAEVSKPRATRKAIA